MEINQIKQYYLIDLKSIPDISKITGEPKSKIRGVLKNLNILRTRKEGFELARHKLGQHAKGKKRKFTKEWISNMSKSALNRKNVKGFCLSSTGYYEFTTGENKGRAIHNIKMENAIGRKLKPNEVVHHIDEIKTNNNIINLRLMTRSEHAKLHAKKNYKNRVIGKDGKLLKNKL